MNLGEFKEEELDASELLNLLDFDDEMWVNITMISINKKKLLISSLDFN